MQTQTTKILLKIINKIISDVNLTDDDMDKLLIENNEIMKFLQQKF